MFGTRHVNTASLISKFFQDSLFDGHILYAADRTAISLVADASMTNAACLQVKSEEPHFKFEVGHQNYLEHKYTCYYV